MEIDLLKKYPKTKRNLSKRKKEKDTKVRDIAREFGKDFFDGDKKYGYGGHYYNEKYWFTSNKIEKIEKVHNYLENLEHVGKVLSFRSVLKVAEGLNNNKPLGSLEMGVLYTKLPENIKNEIATQNVASNAIVFLFIFL